MVCTLPAVWGPILPEVGHLLYAVPVKSDDISRRVVVECGLRQLLDYVVLPVRTGPGTARMLIPLSPFRFNTPDSRLISVFEPVGITVVQMFCYRDASVTSLDQWPVRGQLPYDKEEDGARSYWNEQST